MDTLKWTMKFVLPFMGAVNGIAIPYSYDDNITVFAIKVLIFNGVALAISATFCLLSIVFVMANAEKEKEAASTLYILHNQKLSDVYHETATYHPLCSKLSMDVAAVSGKTLSVSVYMLKGDAVKCKKHLFLHFYFNVSLYSEFTAEVFHKHALSVLEDCYYGKFFDRVFIDSRYKDLKSGYTLKQFLDSFEKSEVISWDETTEKTIIEK
jgi:hypothetical protein